MVNRIIIEWHKFWFITFNSLLSSTSSYYFLSYLHKKSKYHHIKLVQLL